MTLAGTLLYHGSNLLLPLLVVGVICSKSVFSFYYALCFFAAQRFYRFFLSITPKFFTYLYLAQLTFVSFCSLVVCIIYYSSDVNMSENTVDWLGLVKDGLPKRILADCFILALSFILLIIPRNKNTFTSFLTRDFPFIYDILYMVCIILIPISYPNTLSIPYYVLLSLYLVLQIFSDIGTQHFISFTMNIVKYYTTLHFLIIAIFQITPLRSNISDSSFNLFGLPVIIDSVTKETSNQLISSIAIVVLYYSTYRTTSKQNIEANLQIEISYEDFIPQRIKAYYFMLRAGLFYFVIKMFFPTGIFIVLIFSFINAFIVNNGVGGIFPASFLVFSWFLCLLPTSKFIHYGRIMSIVFNLFSISYFLLEILLPFVKNLTALKVLGSLGYSNSDNYYLSLTLLIQILTMFVWSLYFRMSNYLGFWKILKNPDEVQKITSVDAKKKAYLHFSHGMDSDLCQTNSALRSMYKAQGYLRYFWDTLIYATAFFIYEARKMFLTTFEVLFRLFVQWSYVIVLVCLCITALGSIHVINAMFLLIFFVFIASPKISHMLWPLFMSISFAFVITVYIWQIPLISSDTIFSFIGIEKYYKSDFSTEIQPIFFKSYGWVIIAAYSFFQFRVNEFNLFKMKEYPLFCVVIKEYFIAFMDSWGLFLNYFVLVIAALMKDVSIIQLCYLFLFFSIINVNIHFSHFQKILAFLLIPMTLLQFFLLLSIYLYQFKQYNLRIIDTVTDAMYDTKILEIEWGYRLYESFGERLKMMVPSFISIVLFLVQLKHCFLVLFKKKKCHSHGATLSKSTQKIQTTIQNEKDNSNETPIKKPNNFDFPELPEKHTKIICQLPSFIMKFLYLYTPVICSVVTLVFVLQEQSFFDFILFSVMIISFLMGRGIQSSFAPLLWLTTIYSFALVVFNFDFVFSNVVEGNEQLFDWLGLITCHTYPFKNYCDQTPYYNEGIPYYYPKVKSVLVNFLLVIFFIWIERMSVFWGEAYEERHKKKISLFNVPKTFDIFSSKINLTTIKWTMSNFFNIFGGPLTIVCAALALWFHNSDLLGIFYVFVLTILVFLPYRFRKHLYIFVQVFLSVIVLLHYLVVLGPPPIYYMKNGELSVFEFNWEKIPDSVKEFLLLSNKDMTHLFFDSFAVYLISRLRYSNRTGSSISFWRLLHSFPQNGSDIFPQTPRTQHNTIVYYGTLLITPLCGMLVIFVSLIQENVLSLVFIFSGLYVLLFTKYSTKTIRIWKLMKIFNALVICVEIIAGALKSYDDRAWCKSLMNILTLVGTNNDSGITFFANVLMLLVISFHIFYIREEESDIISVLAFKRLERKRRFVLELEGLRVQTTNIMKNVQLEQEERSKRLERIQFLRSLREKSDLSKQAENAASIVESMQQQREKIEKEEGEQEICVLKEDKSISKDSNSSEPSSLEEEETQPNAPEKKSNNKAVSLLKKVGLALVDILIHFLYGNKLESHIRQQQWSKRVHHMSVEAFIDFIKEKEKKVSDDNSYSELSSTVEDDAGEKEFLSHDNDNAIQMDKLTTCFSNGVSPITPESKYGGITRWKMVLYGLFLVLKRNTHVLCVVMFAANMMFNASIMGAVFFFGTFLIITIAPYPQPGRKFWYLLLVYAVGNVLLKFMFQIPGFCICEGEKTHFWYFTSKAIELADGTCGIDKCQTGSSEGANVWSAPYLLGIV
ncbi:SH3 domain-containing protein [Entamoeba marina]